MESECQPAKNTGEAPVRLLDHTLLKSNSEGRQPKTGPLPGHAHPSTRPSERQKAAFLFSGKYVLKETWKKLSNYTGQIYLKNI